MINLRYHIVSIVGIFLALGIGVALGSTFVDGFIVSTLESRVDILQDQRNDARDAMDEQRDALAAEQADRAAQEVAVIPLLGGGRLADTPVMIIAVEGVDTAAVQTVQAALVGTAARYEGTLWLTDGLNLTDEENRVEVKDALGLVDDNESLVRRALEIRLTKALFPDAPDAEGLVLGGIVAELARELVEAAGDAFSIVLPTEPGKVATVLTELRDAALVVYDNEFAFTGALADVPQYGTRFLLVANADADLDSTEIIVPLLEAVVNDKIDVVLVAIEPAPIDDEADPVSFVSVIRNDFDFSRLVATVDDAASFNGTLATLILLDTGDVRHLGSGPGASSVLPPA